MITEKEKAIAVLKIRGMDISGRVEELRRAADKLDGVHRVDINYISETATIEYDADRLTLAQVAEPIRGFGSRGHVRTSTYTQGRREKKRSAGIRAGEGDTAEHREADSGNSLSQMEE